MRAKCREELISFMKENYKKVCSNRELAEMINEKFCTALSLKAVQNIRLRNGMAFRGCRKPRQLYAEKVFNDGYIRVKVQECREGEKARWKLKHRIVWERHHGIIPEGHKIHFIDGNKLNCAIENLTILSNSEHVKLVQYGLLSNNPERLKTGIAIAKASLAMHKALKAKMGEKRHKDYVRRASRMRAKIIKPEASANE